jgi:hypothetical protein
MRAPLHKLTCGGLLAVLLTGNGCRSWPRKKCAGPMEHVSAPAAASRRCVPIHVHALMGYHPTHWSPWPGEWSGCLPSASAEAPAPDEPTPAPPLSEAQPRDFREELIAPPLPDQPVLSIPVGPAG